MKLKKETKQAIGISTVFGALVLSFAFIVLAIRKKSIVQAVLAVIAAACGAASAGALLTALFAPDTEGECVCVTATEEESDAELFSEAESAEAERRMRHVLGGKRDGELAGAPSPRPVIPQDEEATEADFM